MGKPSCEENDEMIQLGKNLGQPWDTLGNKHGDTLGHDLGQPWEHPGTTRGHNGAVMAVMKNIPYFIVPEYDTTILHIVATLSQIIAKVTSNKIVSFQQLALSFGLINLIFVYFLNFVLSL